MEKTTKWEHRWRVFENGVLRRIFGHKRQEVESGYIMRSFITSTFHQLLLGR
jgi:hypothetical protein